MGLRTPSRFKTFGAQAKSGAEKQKQARENLMQPGQATKSALGGRASAGTAMVANTTGAQQAATQNVQETQTQATKDLKVDPTKLGTATVTAIGGTVKPPPATTTTPPPVEYTGGLSAVETADVSPTVLGAVADRVAVGDTSTLSSKVTELSNDITNITNELTKIDEDLKTATAQDAQKLQAEKERLTKLRDEYVKKRDEENLGQIAGQSQAEIDAQAQANLLAQRGPSNVAKLATVFGKRSAMDPALASQIYGKDLEALQGEAAEALSESERAKIAAAEADEQYVAQLDASKKAYEENFGDEERKAELLGMTPEELKGVTQEEAEELFGKDIADRLFDFKDGYISDSQVSLTKRILEQNKKRKEEEKGIYEKGVTDATTKFEENFDNLVGELSGTVDNKGSITRNLDTFDNMFNDAEARLNQINSTPRWRRAKGDSTRAWNYGHNKDVLAKARAEYKNKSKELESLVKNKSRSNYDDIVKLRDELSRIFNDAQRKLIKNPGNV